MLDDLTLRVAALLLLAVFYAAYFVKLLLQRRKGVKTDQIGRGRKPKKTLVIEWLMKSATYAVVPVELVCIVWNVGIQWNALRWCGIAVAAAGVLIFLLAMKTMRESWRAGISVTDKTELVTAGIYRFSRNPAFLGFDLLYIGLLIAFFHPAHLAFALFAVVMLHLQILQEERFLADTFGEAYLQYRNTVLRYIGRRKKRKGLS